MFIKNEGLVLKLPSSYAHGISYSGWLQLDVLMHAKRRKSAC